MKLNKIKVISKKNDYVIKDGVIFAKPAGVTPAMAKDNRMYLVYDLGLKLVIPKGCIALILPPNESSKFSVSQTGNFVLLPGEHESVSIEYKVNTDAIPRVFEKDEVCAQIVILDTANVEFETIVEEDDKLEAEMGNPGVIDAVAPENNDASRDGADEVQADEHTNESETLN